MNLSQRSADLAYGAGWALVRHVPDAVGRRAFVGAGRIAGHRGGGPAQLRRNLSRVLGTSPADVPDDVVAEAVASYARYWYEAFRLPSMDPVRAAADVELPAADRARFQAPLDAGRGVLFALPHMGNWDMAGVWLTQNVGRLTTVAERLEPESLFERFVAYRESLGFEIFPLTGGEQPPYPALADRLRAGGIVCLLAERDLTRHGVPVTFFGEPTRMPAGPARLAIETGAALFPVHHSFAKGSRSRISVAEEIDVTGGVEPTTQRLADALAAGIARRPVDWHMLQPLWEADWSAARRERLA